MSALVLIGSRAKTDRPSVAADEHSDWDFQVVSDRPELFSTRDWMLAAGLGVPQAYALRPGRLGRALKVTAMTAAGELDLVIIPAGRLRLARWLQRLGLVSRLAGVQQSLGDLAVVLQAGYEIVKGEAEWNRFFRWVATEIPRPRLNDAAVRQLAEGFVCDFVFTRRKLARGELLAAQRWLHHHLAETNFRLLHERRQRQGGMTMPDARRLEALATPAEVAAVRVSAGPTREALDAAVTQAGAACRDLVRGLVGETWRWPDGVL